jgi:hypothetical protein|tara:strand:- start:320 stop:460 length:141 start_codon:yes stop_codon:yes gene_type:complete
MAKQIVETRVAGMVIKTEVEVPDSEVKAAPAKAAAPKAKTPKAADA